MPFQSGKRGAKIYETVDALPALYRIDQKVLDLNMARAQLAQKQVEKIDFDMTLKTANLIPYDPMLQAAQRIFVAFRTRICSIPSKLAPKLAGLTDPIDVEEALEEHLNEALDELHDLRAYIERFSPGVVDSSSAGSKAPRKANSK